MTVRMPVLLSSTLETIRPLKAIGLSLTASLRDRSQAQLTASRDESPIPMRSFIDVYTQKGFFATFRVTNSALSNERGRVYTLTHAIDTLRDSVYQMQGTFEGTKEEFLLSLFGYQKDARWQLGYVEDGDAAYKSPNINYTKLSDLFSKFLQDNPDVYPSYDFTTNPWTVHILKLPTEVSARFSLTRNADTCNIVYDDKNMCNRLYLSVNTPEKVNGITKYNTELRTYENAASIAEYNGVIEKTASVKTDEITGGNVDAWANAFLEKYAQPEVNITVDGYELYKQTGEIYDEASVSKRANVSLPEYGTTTIQRIESIQYPDVLNAPTAIVVSLATKQKTFTTAISNLEKEVEKAGGAAGGAALAAANAEEVTDWILVRQKIDEAVEETGIVTLWESGIIVDAETGNKIYSLEQGFVSAFTQISNNSREVAIVAKEGQNNASAIVANAQSITALSKTVNENGEMISGVSLRLDNVETEVEILAQKQVSLDQYENRLATAESSITTNAQSITALSQTVDENGAQISGALVRLNGVESEVEILAQKQVSLDQYENRLATAESSITTNAQSITALSQTVDENGNQISGALLRLNGVESEVEILAQKQVSLDQYENRLSSAEAAITVNANAITSKVSRTDFNALGQRVSNAESAITVNANAIAGKVSQTDFNDLGERVKDAEAAIEINADAITAKVSQTAFNALGQRVSNAESAITVNANAIAGKVSQTDFNDLGERVKDAEAAIEVNADAITAKVSQTDFNALGQRVSNAESAITVNANAIAGKVSQTDFNDLGERVADAEAAIEVNADAITAKVSQTAFDALGQRVSSAESAITVNANAIAAKVSQTDFDTLGQRVSEAEAEITVNADAISSKVSKNGVISEINQTSETVKISASRIALEGLVTASQLQTAIADVNYQNSQAIETLLISANNTDFNLLNASSFTLGSTLMSKKAITMGPISTGQVLAVSNATLDLAHSHAVSVADDGTVTLGAVSVTGGNFKIADTKIYKDGVSAAKDSVTADVTGKWEPGGYKLITLSNDRMYGIFLPEFSSSGGETFNSEHKTNVYFYSEEVTTQPLVTVEVDASGVYADGKAAGAAGVTLDKAYTENNGWVGGKFRVKASNGATYDVSLPELTVKTTAFNATTHKATAYVTTPSVTHIIAQTEVDASGVYDAGYAAGWAAAAAIFDMTWSGGTYKELLTITHAGETPDSENASDTVKITVSATQNAITSPAQNALFASCTARAYANVNGAGAIQRAYDNDSVTATGRLGTS